MTTDNFVRAQLALLAWREGQASGITVMLAIAHMIVNRQKAGWGSLLDCVRMYPTFSAKQLRPDLEPAFPTLNDHNFRTLLQQIDDIANGSAQDNLTMSATNPVTNEPGLRGLYCAELHDVDRDWFVENICRRPEEHPRTATVGGFTFFG